MAGRPDLAGTFSRSAAARVAGGLPVRVVAAVVAALACSILAGAVLISWHARASVALELRTAMAGAVRIVATAPELAAARPMRLERLVRTFDGDRHVRAVLLERGGEMAAQSHPFTMRRPPPDWFISIFDPRQPDRRFAIGARNVLVLHPEATNEVGEVWTGFRDGALILALFLGLAVLLVTRAVVLALRPLSDIDQGMAQIGGGDYAVRIAGRGPAETRRLSGGFNAMAGRLEQMDGENRRLNEQLLTLQEEERAEFARDLHDEIGPQLFAMSIDTGEVRELAAARRWREIAARADLMEGAVGRMQAHVRDMLARLRPIRAVEFGLEPALTDLVAFWRARKPAIGFDLAFDLDEEAMGLGVREALYRVAQEALSNAVRHGRPARISIEARADRRTGVMVRIADDGATTRTAVASAPAFGLAGMRERMEALGGELAAGPTEGGGWAVLARAPIAAAQSELLEAGDAG